MFLDSKRNMFESFHIPVTEGTAERNMNASMIQKVFVGIALWANNQRKDLTLGWQEIFHNQGLLAGSDCQLQLSAEAVSDQS